MIEGWDALSLFPLHITKAIVQAESLAEAIKLCP